MSKSIESIWQNGFIDDMALVAPKVNDLYSQKSQNLIDKFQYMFDVNHKALLIAAGVICAALSFFGAPVLGVLIALMLAGLVLVGRRQLKGLEQINKDESSLAYLKAFDSWLDDAIQQYVKIYRFFYPVLFILCALRFVYSDIALSILAEIDLVAGDGQISSVVFILIAIIASLLGLAGGKIYLKDLDIVYGREIRKLKELISDMKVLTDE